MKNALFATNRLLGLVLVFCMTLRGEEAMAKTQVWKLNSDKFRNQMASQYGQDWQNQSQQAPTITQKPAWLNDNGLTGQAKALAWQQQYAPKPTGLQTQTPATPQGGPSGESRLMGANQPLQVTGSVGVGTGWHPALPAWLATFANRMGANNGAAYQSANPWANSVLSPTVNPNVPGGANYNPNPNPTAAPFSTAPASTPFSTGGQVAPKSSQGPTQTVNPRLHNNQTPGPALIPAPLTASAGEPQIPIGQEGGTFNTDRTQYTDPGGTTWTVNADGTMTPGAPITGQVNAQNWINNNLGFLSSPPAVAPYSFNSGYGGYGGYGGRGGRGGWGGGGGGGYSASDYQKWLENLINWNI